MEHPIQQPVSPTSATHHLTQQPRPSLDTKTPQEQPDTEAGPSTTPPQRHTRVQCAQPNSPTGRPSIGGSRLRVQPSPGQCSLHPDRTDTRPPVASI
jgi:hypothetical protein